MGDLGLGDLRFYCLDGGLERVAHRVTACVQGPSDGGPGEGCVVGFVVCDAGERVVGCGYFATGSRAHCNQHCRRFFDSAF